jgi:hypothetical protein
LVFVLLFQAAPRLGAERTGEYTIDYLSDGSPRFSQVLRWDADPNVLYYEVSLQTGAGVSVLKVTEPELRLSLGPGDYRYRIVLYNLLRKPEIELPWQDFSVLKAEMPRIARCTPKTLFLEDPEARLTLWGEDLVPGARVLMRHEGPEGGSVPASVVEGNEASTIGLAFPLQSMAAGSYSIELTNPGGLSARLSGAVLLRHKLPEPASLLPVKGSVFGPKDLRGMRSIGFSWEPVPEASQYLFRLRAAGNPERVVCEKLLTESAYSFDELSVLDRGEFRWSVEPRGIDGDGSPIPAIRPAEAGFRIDLPPIAAPTVSSGDVFYGW